MPFSRVRYEIAAANLHEARGLPGSESLDIPRCMARIEAIALAVEEKTRLHWPRFKANPDEFNNSEPYFRSLVLSTVIARDFQISYNFACLQSDADLSDSGDTFLHGALFGRGGTCVSMPVLYVAVGRRLGYPLHLVLCKCHMFVRWMLHNGHLNIETTGKGLICHRDEYYEKWPFPLLQHDIDFGYCLRPLQEQEELAVFLEQRAHCFLVNRFYDDALAAFSGAYKLFPSYFPAIMGIELTRGRIERLKADAKRDIRLAECEKIVTTAMKRT